jgi:hypothetical protein
MENANELIQPPVHRGKKKLPVERRRVILSVRVLPSTMEYLEAFAGTESKGKALDGLIAEFMPLHPFSVASL